MRRFFHFLNKYLMVPMFRLGFGPFMGNPFTGYIMVLKVKGRKTGKIRFAPVNYAIHNGMIYCISGFRRAADWYRNLLANPEDVEVILPGGSVRGTVVEAAEGQTRLQIVRKILQNAGFAGFFEGYNPFRISDEALQEKTGDLPLVCIQPTGVGSGASDPGGWAWVGTPVLVALAVWILWLILR